MKHQTDGYYEVRLESSLGKMSAGTMTLTNLKVSGVDLGFLIDGMLSEISETEFAGQLHIKQHNKTVESVFGEFNSYQLMVKGSIENGKAILKGTMVGEENLTAEIKLSRLGAFRKPRGF